MLNGQCQLEFVAHTACIAFSFGGSSGCRNIIPPTPLLSPSNLPVAGLRLSHCRPAEWVTWRCRRMTSDLEFRHKGSIEWLETSKESRDPGPRGVGKHFDPRFSQHFIDANNGHGSACGRPLEVEAARLNDSSSCRPGRVGADVQKEEEGKEVEIKSNQWFRICHISSCTGVRYYKIEGFGQT